MPGGEKRREEEEAVTTLKEALEDKQARHIVSFSGGKDSTALAIYLLNNYPQLKLEFLFCDTGAELDETYRFIERFETLFGVKIKRLDALKLLGVKAKPGRTAFDVYLKEHYSGFLPGPQSRWCTIDLKIKPFEHEIGKDKAYSYIGIRADENRTGYQQKPVVFSDAPNIIPIYPFKEDGIGLDEVKEILKDSGLGMPDYYKWRSRSGCYFCFYQQIGEWQGLRKYHPVLFQRAKTYEKTKGAKRYTWVEGRTLSDIEKLKKQHKVADGENLDGCALCHL